MEMLRNVNRLLPKGAVCNEENFVRIDGLVKFFNFFDEVIVYL